MKDLKTRQYQSGDTQMAKKGIKIIGKTPTHMTV